MVIIGFCTSFLINQSFESTDVVFQQIQFTKNRPIGYSTNNLLTVPIKNNEIHKHFDAFREA